MAEKKQTKEQWVTVKGKHIKVDDVKKYKAKFDTIDKPKDTKK